MFTTLFAVALSLAQAAPAPAGPFKLPTVDAKAMEDWQYLERAVVSPEGEWSAAMTTIGRKRADLHIVRNDGGQKWTIEWVVEAVPWADQAPSPRRAGG